VLLHLLSTYQTTAFCLPLFIHLHLLFHVTVAFNSATTSLWQTLAGAITARQNYFILSDESRPILAQYLSHLRGRLGKGFWRMPGRCGRKAVLEVDGQAGPAKNHFLDRVTEKFQQS
jgi:hypothetical protein